MYDWLPVCLFLPLSLLSSLLFEDLIHSYGVFWFAHYVDQ